MLRSVIFKRFATGGYHGAQQISIPKRPLKKIRLGKARPAIYHKFDVQVELSDGSVITRRSQFPKDQIRLIQDQRNNPLWNQSRDDLVVVDANAGGRLDKFKQKYDTLFNFEAPAKQPAADAKGKDKAKEVKPAPEEETAAAPAAEEEDAFGMDDYMSLLDQNAQQVQSGGKLATKKRDKK
ncbi:LAQU0S04e05776g1_1 [Lachancea quebecensis]|uniref:LAQU0S04e05776g1_1 n=1 Tax=Lachancea quebecensis TaxID=1654605 RepID=A0A0P1KRC1_9SACH|nr:LAQU0S04e05776g1_1 [Lachancea quebecensis]